jgi:heavy metal translocating P-type ATPase
VNLLLDYVWTLILLLVALPLLRATTREAARGNFATDAIASLAIIASILLVEPLPGFIIVLMQTGGESLERMARGRASRALSELEAAAPRIAHKKSGNAYLDVSVDDVEPGDQVLVRPGELVPLDGVVIDGRSHVDTAQITGEPVPLSAEPGTDVMSGYWNLNGPLTVRVNRTAADSQYSRIVELVRAAQNEKAPIQRLADRYAVWFTPLTVLVAVAAWSISGDPTRILAVLVVATPCPLILATPVAILGGINVSAKRRIIVRSGAALERLAGVRSVVFDKTGTLTTGKPAAHLIVPERGWSENELLRVAAALELGSGHLLGRAIVTEAHRRGLTFEIAQNIYETSGRGLEGIVGDKRVAIGSKDFILDNLDDHGMRLYNGARLSSYVAVDGVLAGHIHFDDELRADSKAMIRSLRESTGINDLAILSGDNPDTVHDIAQQLGISEAHGNLKPEQKLELLRRVMRRNGPTLMVGDGTNDAPALAAANVGLAVAPRGGGIATEAADVIILSEDMMRIRDAIVISRRAVRIARQSILVGLGLSGIGMAAAAVGWLQPVAGALFQEAIDVGVILNALRASSLSPLSYKGVDHDTPIDDPARWLALRGAGDRLRDRVGLTHARDDSPREGAPAGG